MDVRNLILDWSGTLFDDLHPVLATTNYVFETFGLAALTIDEFRRDFCLPVRRFYERRIPHITQERLEQTFFAKYPEFHAGIQPLPHAAGFLRFCRARAWPVFIASTADEQTYVSQMKRFDLDQLITRAYLGIEDKTKKIFHILEENELDRRHTLFVGDMEHDIEAGRAGGVMTCAVLTGYNHADTLRRMNPDLVCADLGELQQILDGTGVTLG